MKRSFRNLFMIIVILVTSIASGLHVVPAEAVGAMTTLGLADLPTAVSQGYLHDMWGANSTHIFMVGYGDTGQFTSTKPLIYQTEDATAWTVSIPSIPTNWTAGALEAVWGMDGDASHVFAVGTGGPSGSNLPLVSVWNGSTWTPSSPTLPTTDWTSGQLHGVWGSSLSNVYAVGYGDGTGFTNMPLIFSWNGSAWSSQGLTLPGGYGHAYLVDVWGSSGTNIYAAGRGLDASSTQMPLLYRYTGGAWNPTVLPLPPGWVWGRLDGIWGSADNDIYAVGTGNNGRITAPLIYHWNGSTWTPSEPSLPASSWDAGYLYGVWGFGTSVYAVGYGYNAKPGITTTLPLLYRKTSMGWVAGAYQPKTPTKTWDSGFFRALWGYGVDNVYAAGYGNDGSFNLPLLDYAGSDSTPPGAVVSLGASSGTVPASVTLQWTAPADDGPNPPEPNAGPVTSYVVQYSELDNLTTCDDADGTPVAVGLPTPVLPGNTQTMTVTGLTASTTYYFSVCAKDEQDNLSEVATASAISASTGVTAGIYDDTDPSWIYTGVWTAESGLTGPSGGTLHYGGTGRDARLTFDGVRFTLTYTKASSRGLIDVYVDGTKIDTINANSGATTWQATWTSPTFAPGIHTVRFAHGGGGTYIDVDKIQIFGVASAGIYDDTDVNWAYVGTWLNYVGPNAYNGSQHYTTAGNQAQFTFNGVKFALTYMKASSRGLIDVYVDGKKIAQINARSSTTAWQQVWSSPFLTPGVHTVRFVHAGGGTYIDIDKIQIFEGAAPGIYDNTDPNWFYSGTWTNFSGTGPYNNTARYSGKVGSDAQFAFNGIRFRFTYVKASNRGLIDVYVDGVKIDRITAKSTTLAWQQTYTSPTFTNSVHVVRFVHAGGGTYVDVDALEIFAATDLVKPDAILDVAGVPGGIGGSVDLSWTAVGDDGSVGTATSYQVRYSTSIINSENAWSGASIFTGSLPAPSAPGGTDHATVGGLVPEQAYYFAVRAQDDEGNLGGLSNSPLIVAQSPMPVPAGIYDDTNVNWTYIGAWQTYTGSGPYNNTQHNTSVAGNVAQIGINGVKFTVTYMKATTRGYIDVYVDGKKIGTITAKSSSTAWQQTWTSPLLTAGIHTVRFVHAGGGTYIDIDKIQVIDAVGAGIYDETDSNWSYTGNWISFTGAGPYNDGMRYTNKIGNDAQIIISGVRFKLTYVKASNRGLIDVYVDGTKVGQINATFATMLWQQVWTSPTFTNGVHAVRFVHAGGGTYIDIDAIEVLDSTDMVAPAAITGMTGTAGPTGGSVILNWTAVGDDGNTGTATTYFVRYSTSPITSEAAWATASVFSGTIPAPSASGSPDSVTVTGLAPSQAYYFAVRAQDEEGNLGLLSNSPQVTSQSAMPVSAGIYDDMDGNWVYIGNWDLYSGTGPYNNTQHNATSVGSEAQITVQGAKFIVTYLRATTRGLIDVYIDGTNVGQINANGALAWQQTWTSPTLTAGQHLVRFVFAGGGTYIDIDKIQVIDAVNPGTYEDTDSNWSFGGTWSTYTGSEPSGGSMRNSSKIGDDAQITFNGRSFVLTYVKASNRGSIDVYVDGVKVDTIVATNSALTWQAKWTSATYAAGVHVVRFVHLSGTYIDIDTIQINS